MTSYSQVFGGGTILPGDVSYNTLTTAVDATLVWPREANAGGNVAGAVMDITTTVASLNITMASATGISTGYAVTFYNSGSNSYSVKDAGGTTRATVAAGDAWIFICKNNSTDAGTWLTFQMGAGSASVNAASLAGTGLIASGSLLTLDMPMDSLNSNYSIGTSDRARLKNWTGGSGTITLLAAGTGTNGFYFCIRNTGSGSLSINRAGSDVINGSATSFTLAVGESTWFNCDGTGWYTYGYGRALSGGSFALLSIDVSGTGDYTLSAGQLNQVGYKLTGTITGARNIIVPTTVAQYWVDNQTTGAFTLTVKTAAGSGVVVPTGSRYILYVDGSGVVDADTGSFSSPLAVADGGTGATTASSARTNLGATSIGNSLFTASTTAAARTAIGSGAVGDSVFTGATAAAIQTTLSVPPTSRTISTSGYTTGGGDLSANRTITLGSMGAVSRLLGSGSASATIADITLGSNLSMSGTTLSVSGITPGNTNSDPVITVYTTGSGTHTPNANAKWMRVRLVGGGGGGGGNTNANVGESVPGAGGGGGGYVEHWYATPSALSYAVGAAGTGGIGAAGGAGGNTTFGTLTASGGGGGAVGTSAGSFFLRGVPGSGGAASGGNIANAAGGPGGPSGGSSAGGISGYGGNSALGGGGALVINQSTNTVVACNAGSVGGGGSGSCNFNKTSSGTGTGGDGGAGIIIVEEYIWT